MPKFELDYDDGIALYDNAIKQAEDEVIKRGLPISSMPLGMDGDFAKFPSMPPDLSQTTFPELQRLIGQFTAWFGYAIGQLKLAEGFRNAAEKQRAFAWSSIRALKSGTVSDKDDAVRTDSRYARIDAHYEHCDALVRIYGAIVEGLKRDIETISRAASVLEARTGVEGRGVAVGRKGRTEMARETFRTGRRSHDETPRKAWSGLDVFKKRNTHG
jgi:hypothetical protein